MKLYIKRVLGFRYEIKISTLLVLIALISGCSDTEESQLPPPPQVVVGKPLVKEIIEWDEFTGRIEPIEAVDIRARVSGYLESIHFEDGDVVKEGDLLFVIDPRPYQAEVNRTQANLELARSRLELAKNDFARAQKLLQSKAISEEEVDTRASNLEETEASVRAAQANLDLAKLNLEFTRIKAPITGRVSRELVTKGNLISGGSDQSTLLTTIVSLDPIHCYFEADERLFLKYVRLAQEGLRPSSRDTENPVFLALADEQGFPHRGYMDFVDNRLDPNTGTMTGRAIFDNEDLTLTPGLFARVRLLGSGLYDAVMIPDSAVGSDQAQRFVFVINEDNIAQYRKVDLGPIMYGLRVVREGISAEDLVVIKGLQKVSDGIKVDPILEEIEIQDDENEIEIDLSAFANPKNSNESTGKIDQENSSQDESNQEQ